MSANNQILIKEYKDKFYVFDNVMAEAWASQGKNKLSTSRGIPFDTHDEAYEYAIKLDRKGETEYGIGYHLIKDGSRVTIIE